MQGQASAPAVGPRSDEAEFVVLALLLEQVGPAQWSLAELAREVGCELAVVDAVVRLDAASRHRAGEIGVRGAPGGPFLQLLREWSEQNGRRGHGPNCAPAPLATAGGMAPKIWLPAHRQRTRAGWLAVCAVGCLPGLQPEMEEPMTRKQV